MLNLLRALFLAILFAMLSITVIASLDRSVFLAGRQLWPDPWFRATLADAYFGFLTVYVWIAYKETTWTARLVWFVLLMALGNIAIPIYVLLQLRHARDGALESVLLRRLR